MLRPDRPALAGLVLAAGAGTRFGGPKALARTSEGQPWSARLTQTLRAGGCGRVLVTLGAEREAAALLLPDEAQPVAVEDWRVGVSASLRAGLAAARRAGAECVLVVTVDIPDVPVAAVERLAALAGPDAAAQATYGGRPGHPVILGRARWDEVAASLAADRGAGAYLRAHGTDIECGDLWSGVDIDRS
ncbi:NTP transferase domain-containing protein [Microbacterium sp. NPDC089189]|uniref:nucleotidyltransferase family protein n=1 Tax=Microbacterium sp. NPDC089189 TaxID=3154972 RepID=UPI00341CED3E